MESIKTSSKGQMVIPKSVREALGIHTGTTLQVELLPDRAFIDGQWPFSSPILRHDGSRRGSTWRMPIAQRCALPPGGADLTLPCTISLSVRVPPSPLPAAHTLTPPSPCQYPPATSAHLQPAYNRT